jgi:carbonic anhydrase/acetyltransferase-like protein (isoleucine patch superfamily)
MLYDLGNDKVSAVDEEAYFVAPNAVVIGRVQLGRDASIWFGAVLRADTDTITIGERSNVQDGAVLHVDTGAPAVLGAAVTVGHAATVHGCRIGDGSLIGIGATILSHAVIGRHCIVGAHALVTERKEFPDRSLILGAPARRVREITAEEIAELEAVAEHYAELARRYRRELRAR